MVAFAGSIDNETSAAVSLGDDGRQEFSQAWSQRTVFIGQRAEQVLTLLDVPFECGRVELFLRSECGIKRAAIDAELVDEVLHRGCFETLRPEQLDGLVQRLVHVKVFCARHGETIFLLERSVKYEASHQRGVRLTPLRWSPTRRISSL